MGGRLNLTSMILSSIFCLGVRASNSSVLFSYQVKPITNQFTHTHTIPEESHTPPSVPGEMMAVSDCWSGAKY